MFPLSLVRQRLLRVSLFQNKAASHIYVTGRTSRNYSKQATAEVGTDDSSKAPLQLEKSVKLTDRCVHRLKEICKDGSLLRLAVEGGGCSGFQYTFSLDKEKNKDDRMIERDGVAVIVDEISLSYLEGATLDFHTELIRSAFRVLQNPKAESGCSCGASFSLKVD